MEYIEKVLQNKEREPSDCCKCERQRCWGEERRQISSCCRDNKGQRITERSQTDVRTSVWKWLRYNDAKVTCRQSGLCNSQSAIGSKAHQRMFTLLIQGYLLHNVNNVDRFNVKELPMIPMYMHIYVLLTSIHLSELFVLISTARPELWPAEQNPHTSTIIPLANWKSHLVTSLAFSAQINWSMNQWEGLNRLCLWGNGLLTYAHASNLYYWHVSNPANHAVAGRTAWQEKRLYVKENMLLDLTVAHC